jgi:predicted ATPase
MVHTGGHTEYAPVGHATNLAARMQSVAPAGSVVISDDTRRLVEGYFELRDLGLTEVKGISEPINVYEVTGDGPLRGHFELAARRGLTKFVGRSNELEQMRRTLELVLAGHGQIVATVGDAGAGKSRLVYEFKARLPSESKVLEAYSVSHGKTSAYQPVLELLFGYFGIGDIDDKAERRAKIETRLDALDPALNDILPYLFAVLGIQGASDPLAHMDLQIKRRRTLEALKRIPLRESLNQPVVIIFEDLQWIDFETQALLDLLADAVANARVMLLVSYRPEYRNEWGNKSYYTQLRLDPLGRESTEELLGALLGEAVEVGQLKRLIAQKTGGNPFFIEEIVQALFDEGALVRNGTVKVARALSQLRLPPTVQAILASRIDRLAAENKDLLQTLAVMGRESPLVLIRKIATRAHGELDQMLSALREGDFIYEQFASSGIEYTFKHALTQEVAYNSLLIEQRKQLHERAAQAIESVFADNLDDHLADLAHHYSRGDNVSKAVEYLGRLAQQAWQRAAHTDAISNFSAAIALLQRLPDSSQRTWQELLLQLGLGPALMAAKGYSAQEAEQAFTRAQQLCERLGDPPQLFHALFGLLFVHVLRLNTPTAYQLAERLQRLAQTANESGLLLLAHVATGNVLFAGSHCGGASKMDDLLRAREHLKRQFPFTILSAIGSSPRSAAT